LVVAVGIRIVDLARFRKNLTDGFISGAFLPEETGYAGTRARRHESFAARFAAKEAVIDALGGRGSGIGLNQVEVLRNSGSGEVGIRLHGEAAERAARQGVDGVSVSMSHSWTAALALVVLTRNEEKGGRRCAPRENGRGGLEQHRQL
jgi:phosphopantetheine--protein transferase-like protein